jgi:hypothetical protein
MTIPGLSKLLSEVEHMKRFHGNRTLAMLFFPLISVKMLLAAPPDLRLLSLVPWCPDRSRRNEPNIPGPAKQVSPAEPQQRG